ncbi:MAG: HNH endonuclease [Hyphomicrobiaceae bacterium]|nr:HNH endonuclease [Hyphomicrobiaceae bacterium]
MFTYPTLADRVWAKARYVGLQAEASGFRHDACGAWIHRHSYGNRDSPYGWEIDHISPESNGGSDALSNLRPLHWRNNVAKSDGRLACAVTSAGAQNVSPTLLSGLFLR